MSLSDEIRGHSLYVARFEINDWADRIKELEETNERLRNAIYECFNDMGTSTLSYHILTKALQGTET